MVRNRLQVCVSFLSLYFPTEQSAMVIDDYKSHYVKAFQAPFPALAPFYLLSFSYPVGRKTDI
jgi:hypothetical protein